MEALATDRESAHTAANWAYREAQRIISEGKHAVITANPQEDDLYVQRLAFYWGVVLKHVSEQARTPAQWDADAWHGLFKRKFLGYTIEKERVAGAKRIYVTRRLTGLRDLKKQARKLAAFIAEVQAYAVTDLGVVFPEEQRP
jgi:hypothetical protein